MEKFFLKDKYTCIEVKSSFDSVSQYIKPYFYSYMDIENNSNNEKSDIKLYLFNDEKQNSRYENELDGNPISISKANKEVATIIKSRNEEAVLYIKRVLENLRNRILESKGALFLHSSGVSIDNNGILFIGNKGNGKTTNMLYMLERENVSYISNDNAALMPTENRTDIIAAPTRMNIRIGTLENNQHLKEKLWNSINIYQYYDLLNNYNETNTNERLLLSLEDLKTNLGIKESPIVKLNSIVYTQYDKNTKFDMKRITTNDMLALIKGQVINGVYKEHKILESCIDKKEPNIEDFINNDYNYFYLKQNCNNSDKIYSILSRDLRKEMDINERDK